MQLRTEKLGSPSIHPEHFKFSLRDTSADEMAKLSEEVDRLLKVDGNVLEAMAMSYQPSILTYRHASPLSLSALSELPLRAVPTSWLLLLLLNRYPAKILAANERCPHLIMVYMPACISDAREADIAGNSSFPPNKQKK